MHSIRMRTARSSSHPRGSPPGTPTRSRHPPQSRHPPDQTPPWDHTPQCHTSPRVNTPGTTHTTNQTPPWSRHPPVNRMTDRCKNITLPQTSFAGGNQKKNYNKTVLPILHVGSWLQSQVYRQVLVLGPDRKCRSSQVNAATVSRV